MWTTQQNQTSMLPTCGTLHGSEVQTPLRKQCRPEWLLTCCAAELWSFFQHPCRLDLQTQQKLHACCKLLPCCRETLDGLSAPGSAGNLKAQVCDMPTQAGATPQLQSTRSVPLPKKCELDHIQLQLPFLCSNIPKMWSSPHVACSNSTCSFAAHCRCDC